MFLSPLSLLIQKHRLIVAMAVANNKHNNEGAESIVVQVTYKGREDPTEAVRLVNKALANTIKTRGKEDEWIIEGGEEEMCLCDGLPIGYAFEGDLNEDEQDAIMSYESIEEILHGGSDDDEEKDGSEEDDEEKNGSEEVGDNACLVLSLEGFEGGLRPVLSGENEPKMLCFSRKGDSFGLKEEGAFNVPWKEFEDYGYVLQKQVVEKMGEEELSDETE